MSVSEEEAECRLLNMLENFGYEISEETISVFLAVLYRFAVDYTKHGISGEKFVAMAAQAAGAPWVKS